MHHRRCSTQHRPPTWLRQPPQQPRQCRSSRLLHLICTAARASDTRTLSQRTAKGRGQQASPAARQSFRNPPCNKLAAASTSCTSMPQRQKLARPPWQNQQAARALSRPRLKGGSSKANQAAQHASAAKLSGSIWPLLAAAHVRSANPPVQQPCGRPLLPHQLFPPVASWQKKDAPAAQHAGWLAAVVLAALLSRPCASGASSCCLCTRDAEAAAYLQLLGPGSRTLHAFVSTPSKRKSCLLASELQHEDWQRLAGLNTQASNPGAPACIAQQLTWAAPAAAAARTGSFSLQRTATGQHVLSGTATEAGSRGRHNRRAGQLQINAI